jgi:NAD(P)-dependent dehydrogenase (short-subunit alcohol dehydrogenase family)
MSKRSKTTPRENKDLQGRVAVITGASRGIGLAIGDALAAAGCGLAITARHAGRLRQAAKRLEPHKVAVLSESCDVSDPKAVEDFFRAIKMQFGKVDFLINNAGMAHPLADIEKLSWETWRQVLETNLSGLFLVTRSALPLMSPGGTIVNNLSVASKQVFKGMSAYCASKFGALGFTDALREEVRERGIRVVALVPGAVDTDIWDQFWPEAPRERMVSPATIAQAVLHAVSLPKEAVISELMIGPTAGTL